MVVGDERATFHCDKNCDRRRVLNFMYIFGEVIFLNNLIYIEDIKKLCGHPTHHEEK